MGVEQERRDAQRQDGRPEVDQVGNPDRHGGIQQQEQVSHAHVDTRTGETGVKDAEGDAGSGKSTTGSNVSGTTKGQIVENRVGVDLSREDFEHRRE